MNMIDLTFSCDEVIVSLPTSKTGRAPGAEWVISWVRILIPVWFVRCGTGSLPLGSPNASSSRQSASTDAFRAADCTETLSVPS